MLELYHFGSAICAQKVRIALYEKGVDWISREINLEDLRAPDYLAVNPNGVVPSLTVDGVVLTESRLISEFIDNRFPEPPLMPADPLDRHRVRMWTKQVDDSLHLNVFILSFALYIKDQYQNIPKDQWASKLPGLTNPIKREISIDILENGINSRYLTMAINRFASLVDSMEGSLQRHRWLAGETYSLADADLTPYARRLEDLGLSALFNARPHLSEWIERCRARPSYSQGIDRWLTAEEREIASMSREKGTAMFATLLEQVMFARCNTRQM